MFEGASGCYLMICLLKWNYFLPTVLMASSSTNERKTDSHGCFKERDKENRKQERREEKYCQGKEEVAGSKQGACCQ